MPKLRTLSAKQVCKILQKHGFVTVRQTAVTSLCGGELPNKGITVPVPNHSEIAKGTLKSIIDQSEVARSEFMT